MAVNKSLEGSHMNLNRDNIIEFRDTGSYPKRTSPEIALRELFELLEDYAPVWYTQENHDRAVAALKKRA
jgi:hypothetical protein